MTEYRMINGMKVEIHHDFVPYEMSIPSYHRIRHPILSHRGDKVETPQQALAFLANNCPNEG